MADDAATRVYLSRNGAELVLGCEHCGARHAVDPDVSVVDQLLGYLDEHAHSG